MAAFAQLFHLPAQLEGGVVVGGSEWTLWAFLADQKSSVGVANLSCSEKSFLRMVRTGAACKADGLGAIEGGLP